MAITDHHLTLQKFKKKKIGCENDLLNLEKLVTWLEQWSLA